MPDELVGLDGYCYLWRGGDGRIGMTDADAPDSAGIIPCDRDGDGFAPADDD